MNRQVAHSTAGCVSPLMTCLEVPALLRNNGGKREEGRRERGREQERERGVTGNLKL